MVDFTRLKAAANEFSAAVNEVAGTTTPPPVDPPAPPVLGSIRPEWAYAEQFGLVATSGNDASEAEANSQAWETKIADYVSGLRIRAVRIVFGPGMYYFARTPRLHNGFFHLLGLGSGLGGQGGTFFRTPEDCDGIQVDDYNTNGYFNDDSGGAGESAAGSVLEGINFWSQWVQPPGDLSWYRKYRDNGARPPSGILLRTRALIRNCQSTAYKGYGITILGGVAGGWRGNANNFHIEASRAAFCGISGLWVAGSDANAGTINRFDGSWCTEYGVQEDSFLGNTYIGSETENNGWYPMTAAYPTLVFNKGFVWKARCVDESDALRAKFATVEPGTEGDHPAVWSKFYATDAAQPSIPQWVPGGTYTSGGAYCGTNANNRNVWLGCYAESGQPPSDFRGRDLVLGGARGDYVTFESPPALIDNNWTKPLGSF